MINKTQETQLLSWNPNWENHQYFLLLHNYIYKYLFPATTNKHGTTPYLPTTTGMRIQPPGLSATTKRILIDPIY